MAGTEQQEQRAWPYHPNSLAQLTEEGRELAHAAQTKHGIYYHGAMLCDRCCLRDKCEAFREGGECAIERGYIERRGAQLQAALLEAGEDAELQEPLIAAALIAEVRLARAQRFLSVAGEFLPGAQDGFLEFQPAAKQLPALIRSAQQSLDCLNLSPQARARLAAQRTVMQAGNPWLIAHQIVDGAVVADDEGGDGDEADE
jgi:hypothetical protein